MSEPERIPEKAVEAAVDAYGAYVATQNERGWDVDAYEAMREALRAALKEMEPVEYAPVSSTLRLLGAAAAALERVQVGDCEEAGAILSAVVNLDGTARESEPERVFTHIIEAVVEARGRRTSGSATRSGSTRLPTSLSASLEASDEQGTRSRPCLP